MDIYSSHLSIGEFLSNLDCPIGSDSRILAYQNITPERKRTCHIPEPALNRNGGH